MKKIRAVASVILGSKKKDDDDEMTCDFPEHEIVSFRVYIHRRNKLIHAWLRVSSTEIALEKSENDILVWPYQLLRRYGYTSAGIFFFESGRRCQSGEGLHSFQSKKAVEIFQLVQSNIEHCASQFVEHRNSISSSRRQSSSSCLASNNVVHQFPPRDRSSTSSIASTFSLRSRGGNSQIRAMPSSVQRFRSEGPGSEFFTMNASVNNSDIQKYEPNTYHSYHQGTHPRFTPTKPGSRPRSATEFGEDDFDPGHIHAGTIQPMRSCSSSRVHNIISSDNRLFGNILSQRSNSRIFATDQPVPAILPPYINISAKEVANDSGISLDRNLAMVETASALTAAVKQLTASHGSSSSSDRVNFVERSVVKGTPPPLLRHRFTVYQADQISRSMVDMSPSKERSDFTRNENYVNLADLEEHNAQPSGPVPAMIETVTDRPPTHSPSPLVNYAYFVPSTEDVNSRILTQRCLSAGRASDVNYAQLDVDRTRAVGQIRRSTESAITWLDQHEHTNKWLMLAGQKVAVITHSGGVVSFDPMQTRDIWLEQIDPVALDDLLTQIVEVSMEDLRTQLQEAVFAAAFRRRVASEIQHVHKTRDSLLLDKFVDRMFWNNMTSSSTSTSTTTTHAPEPETKKLSVVLESYTLSPPVTKLYPQLITASNVRLRDDPPERQPLAATEAPRQLPRVPLWLAAAIISTCVAVSIVLSTLIAIYLICRSRKPIAKLPPRMPAPGDFYTQNYPREGLRSSSTYTLNQDRISRNFVV